MPKFTPIFNNFSAGEVSPLIKDRVDLATYQNSCLTLENCFILPQGGLVGRSGTYFIYDSKNSTTDTCRLTPFHFSNTQAYCLEFGNEYIRFYKDSGIIIADSPAAWVTATYYIEGDFVTSGGVTHRCLVGHLSGTFATDESAGKWTESSIYEISTPYQAGLTTNTDIRELQTESSADSLFIVHGDYYPMVLQRYSHTKWVLKEIPFSPPPYYDKGITHATITMTPSATTGTAITITASSTFFLAKDTSRILTSDLGGRAAITTVASGTSVTACVLETFSSTAAIPAGSWHLLGHADAYLHDANANASLSEGTVFNCHTEELNDSDAFGWHSEDVGRYVFFYGGCAEVLSVTYSYSAKLKILYQPSTNLVSPGDPGIGSDENRTCNWSMGDTEFNSTRKYPNTISFYENRLGLANTTARPTTLWLSVSDDYDNFCGGSLADNSLFYTFTTRLVNGVTWLAPTNQLIVGSLGSEWKIGSGVTEDPLTPTNVNAKMQTQYGGNLQQAVMAFESIFFIQRGGKRIRKFSYAYERNGWTAVDVTTMADHIVTDKLENLTLVQEPFATLVCLDWSPGTMLSMQLTGVSNQGSFVEVAGWARQITNGYFRSIAVLKTENTNDEIWVVANRIVGGTTYRFIERFTELCIGDSVDLRDRVCLDSALTYDAGDEKTVTAISKATECEITSSSHGMLDDEYVRFIISDGMTELNGHVYKVSDKASNTFKIKTLAGSHVDSTTYTTFTSGTFEKVVHSVSGLSHLEGCSVKAVVDGIFHDDYTVTSGAVTLNGSGDTGYGNTIHVGVGYEIKIVFPIVEGGSALGTARGKPKRINKLLLQFNNTLGPVFVGTDEDNLQEVALGDNASLFTGPVELIYDENYGIESTSVMVYQPEPRPFCLLSATYFLTTYDS